MKIETLSSMIKTVKRIIATSLILLSAFTPLSLYAEEILLDKIVAVVEDDVITENELLERLNVIYSQAPPDISLPTRSVLIEQILQRMIMERLQVQRAERLGITVDNLSLDQTMRNLASRNRMSLEEFRDTLIREGINYEDFREQVKNELIISQLRNRVVDSAIEINESEVDELIASQQGALRKNAEFLISHILISLPEAPSSENIEKAKSKAEEIRAEVLAGKDFDQLAISESDASNALTGGDLGWRQAAQVPSVFARELNTMEAGDISPVIRSASGYHVFKLKDIRGLDQQMVDQIHARHILIRTNALMSDEQAEQQLLDIRSKILAGDEDFATLAKSISEDPASAVEGGDLNWLTPDTFDPAFRRVVETIPVGELSMPFKSRFGWHIAEVLDRRKHDDARESIRRKAREFIRQRKIEEETEIWLRELRDESYVENRLSDPQES